MGNYLKLTLTDLGKKTMLRLISLGKKPSLTIGISHLTDKFSGDEADLLSKFQILPEAKVTLQDDETKLHIQAVLASSSPSNDIYQIALFLNTMPEENGKPILFANYHSTELLAKKLAQQDMVLDVIVCLEAFKANDFTIEMKDVLPMFNMPAATHERHGSVRLATTQDIQVPPKTNELALSTALLADSMAIAEKKPGFILTTNHLDHLIPRAHGPQTFKPVAIYEGTAAMQERAEDILSFASYCDDNFIYRFIAIKNAEGNNKLFLSRYDFKAKTIQDSSEIEEVSTLLNENSVLPSTSAPFWSYDGKNGMDCYFFTEKNKNNILRKLNVQAQGKLVSKLESGQPNSITAGQLFLYNQSVCNIAASASKEIVITFFDERLNHLPGPSSLTYRGSHAFAHVIKDQVVCLAMTEEDAVLSPRVTIYKFSNSKPTFTCLPSPPSAALDFKPFAANSKILSESLDFAIYFFSLQSQPNTVLKSKYYQYDMLNNHWTELAFQTGDYPLSMLQQASLAKRGKQIYLCVRHVDKAKSIVLFIIKLSSEEATP